MPVGIPVKLPKLETLHICLYTGCIDPKAETELQKTEKHDFRENEGWN
jgi:hypothetical protein